MHVQQEKNKVENNITGRLNLKQETGRPRELDIRHEETSVYEIVDKRHNKECGQTGQLTGHKL